MKKCHAVAPLVCALAVVVATTVGNVAGAAAPWQQAQWIVPSAGAVASNPPPLFRKDFVVAAKPTSATLRIVGLGDYDVRINGHRLAETGIIERYRQAVLTHVNERFGGLEPIFLGATAVRVAFTKREPPLSQNHLNQPDVERLEGNLVELLEKSLSRKESALVLGKGGEGKTTSLRQLALAWAKRYCPRAIAS